jgi:hypothetical protein
MVLNKKPLFIVKCVIGMFMVFIYYIIPPVIKDESERETASSHQHKEDEGKILDFHIIYENKELDYEIVRIIKERESGFNNTTQGGFSQLSSKLSFFTINSRDHSNYSNSYMRYIVLDSSNLNVVAEFKEYEADGRKISRVFIPTDNEVFYSTYLTPVFIDLNWESHFKSTKIGEDASNLLYFLKNNKVITVNKSKYFKFLKEIPPIKGLNMVEGVDMNKFFKGQLLSHRNMNNEAMNLPIGVGFDEFTLYKQNNVYSTIHNPTPFHFTLFSVDIDEGEFKYKLLELESKKEFNSDAVILDMPIERLGLRGQRTASYKIRQKNNVELFYRSNTASNSININVDKYHVDSKVIVIGRVKYNPLTIISRHSVDYSFNSDKCKQPLIITSTKDWSIYLVTFNLCSEKNKVAEGDFIFNNSKESKS